MTITTTGSEEVVRIRNCNQVIFESHMNGGDSVCSLKCGGSEADSIHIVVGAGGNKVEIRGSQDMLIYAAEHLHIQSKKITMLATEAQGIAVEAKTGPVGVKAKLDIGHTSTNGNIVDRAEEGNIGAFAKQNVTVDAANDKVTVHGKGGVGINSEAAIVQTGNPIHLNPDS